MYFDQRKIEVIKTIQYDKQKGLLSFLSFHLSYRTVFIILKISFRIVYLHTHTRTQEKNPPTVQNDTDHSSTSTGVWSKYRTDERFVFEGI